jgi:septum formation topological specificity factor MinE|tara:strand:+ start:357 stop:593 length:237 start_codon:yes stop_codon:yes gene_type:complete
MRKDLIEVSKLHFKAHVEKHRINVENLLEKGVGVAEHADIMDTIEKELGIIAEYDDKLEVLKKYFPIKNTGNKEVLNG